MNRQASFVTLTTKLSSLHDTSPNTALCDGLSEPIYRIGSVMDAMGMYIASNTRARWIQVVGIAREVPFRLRIIRGQWIRDVASDPLGWPVDDLAARYEQADLLARQMRDLIISLETSESHPVGPNPVRLTSECHEQLLEMCRSAQERLFTVVDCVEGILSKRRDSSTVAHEMPLLVTRDDIAKLLEVTRKTVERWMNDKHSHAPDPVDLQKPYRYSWDLLRSWLERKCGRRLPVYFPRPLRAAA